VDEQSKRCERCMRVNEAARRLRPCRVDVSSSAAAAAAAATDDDNDDAEDAVLLRLHDAA